MLKFMENMMGFMIDRTSKEEKQEMMTEMMDRFFADMTAEDKQNMMEAIMPKMMEGMNMMDMMDMMPKMMMGIMGGEKGEGCMETSGMPQMMMEMMPHCLTMMLPHVPKDKRMDFTLNMIATLIQQNCIDMSEEEKQQFVAKVMEKIHAAVAGE